MLVEHLDDAPIAEWHVTDPVMGWANQSVPIAAPRRAAPRQHRAYTHMTRTSAYCVVVAIGLGEPDTYRPALQLAAYEATHCGLAIKLVHGCVEQPGLAVESAEAGVQIRRGRRILNAAARKMRELVDDQVRVYTLSSPMTAVDSLLGESLTAPLIVLQRPPSTIRPAPGSTLSVVATQASCPVGLAPSRNARRLTSGLRIKVQDHDKSALARSEAWDEAALRRVPLIVEHAWDGPYSRTSSTHLRPSSSDLQRERARDLRRLAEMVTAMEI